ncbi:hypothetical protein L596_006387 [Steinernema carpocapsae]|uniref:RNA-directed DNA polymerase n=1 Tax=Steinernema carpocapsae TaxID=34508 RepID=A0A4U8V1X3_STECR|nr:hypothetical protein L596_006387 [Steinernema carpocapsae]
MIPYSLRHRIITQFHAVPPTNAHLGRDKTYQKLRTRVYWPGLYEDITTVVRACPACQERKTTPQHGFREPMTLPELPTGPYQPSSHRHLRTSAEIFNTEGIRPRHGGCLHETRHHDCSRHHYCSTRRRRPGRRLLSRLWIPVSHLQRYGSTIHLRALQRDLPPSSASLTSRPLRIINLATDKSNDSTTR